MHKSCSPPPPYLRDSNEQPRLNLRGPQKYVKKSKEWISGAGVREPGILNLQEEDKPEYQQILSKILMELMTNFDQPEHLPALIEMSSNMMCAEKCGAPCTNKRTNEIQPSQFRWYLMCHQSHHKVKLQFCSKTHIILQQHHRPSSNHHRLSASIT